MSRPAGASLPGDVAVPGGLRRASGWDFKCRLGLDRSCTEVVYRSLMEVVSQSRSLGGNLVKITSLRHRAAAGREAGGPASVGPPLGKLKPAESFLWKTNGSTEGKGKSRKSGLGRRSAEPARR